MAGGNRLAAQDRMAHVSRQGCAGRKPLPATQGDSALAGAPPAAPRMQGFQRVLSERENRVYQFLKQDEYGRIYHSYVHQEGTCPDVLSRELSTHSRQPSDGLDSPLRPSMGETPEDGVLQDEQIVFT